mgnify:CR=1 FL=1
MFELFEEGSVLQPYLTKSGDNLSVNFNAKLLASNLLNFYDALRRAHGHNTREPGVREFVNYFGLFSEDLSHRHRLRVFRSDPDQIVKAGASEKQSSVIVLGFIKC